ncbi:MAG TPA: hypothetical protein VG077_07005 [Verrucomicrobiae bacterium]|nr:hypothetical protein [Verrucomicrobiae bacterium]
MKKTKRELNHEMTNRTSILCDGRAGHPWSATDTGRPARTE